MQEVINIGFSRISPENLGVPGCGCDRGSRASSARRRASQRRRRGREREGEGGRVVEMLRWHWGGRIWVCLGVCAIEEAELPLRVAVLPRDGGEGGRVQEGESSGGEGGRVQGRESSRER
ncbi:hypothetical protein FF1_022102 [Malus domestica]